MTPTSPDGEATPADPGAIDLKWTQRILAHWCKEYEVVLPTDFIADEIYSTYLREVEALRARVTLLQIDRDKWANLAGHNFHDEHGALVKAEVRADAAEARVVELEDKLTVEQGMAIVHKKSGMRALGLIRQEESVCEADDE